MLVELSKQSEVMRYIVTGETWPQVRAEQVATAQLDHWRRHGFGWRAAIDKETDKAIGFIALNFAGEGTAGLAPDEHEIGWWLTPETWGNGLAREGAEAVRDDAFRTLDAPSIVARIQSANRPSLGVAAALGLTPDFETTGNAGEQLCVHRLLARDWIRRRNQQAAGS